MPDSLSTLEAQRAQTQLQISRLGDMRSGSITTTSGRCATRLPLPPADDPVMVFLSLNRKVNENPLRDFQHPTTLRKAQQEVEEFHRFVTQPRSTGSQREDLQTAAAEDTLTPQEKKRWKRSSRKLPKK